jgi:hypothetical protein
MTPWHDTTIYEPHVATACEIKANIITAVVYCKTTSPNKRHFKQMNSVRLRRNSFILDYLKFSLPNTEYPGENDL